MSYILDALRRADAERERGSVPGLHAQQVPALPGDARAANGAPPWLWVAGGAVLVLAGVGAWTLLGGDHANAPAPVTAAPEPAPPPMPALSPAPAPLPAPAPMPAAAPPAIAKAPAPVVQAPSPQAAPARKPSVAAAPAPAPKPEATADAKIYRQDELPDAIRRELPALAIGGSMYSESPANRMLIVNGQLLHEGDSPAPDLVLEQIRLKGAVLRYKGYRYQLNF